MSIRKMGEMGRMAAMTAAMAGAEMVNPEEAAAAAPTHAVEMPEQHYDEARDQKLMEWVSDFGVEGLDVRRVGVKGLGEWVDVFVNGKMIQEVSHPSSAFTKDDFRSAVGEALTAHGYKLETPETELGRMKFAEEVSFKDMAKTQELMKTWGIVFDGYSIQLQNDPTNPLTPEGDPNAKLTFGHIGDDTVTVTYVEKDGDTGTLSITNGKIVW
jgi:hypothetical protein